LKLEGETVACVSWVEAHKDFFLVMGALVAAFGAVFVGLYSSRRQAKALLESTRMQIRAGALREYRQRNIDKLREELAAEMFYVSQLRFKHQKVGAEHSEAVQMVEEAHARKIRIRLLVMSASEQLDECFDIENKLINQIRRTPGGRVWSEADNLAFDRQVDALGALNLRILDSELQAAAGEKPG
jgi:hypothetical protein